MKKVVVILIFMVLVSCQFSSAPEKPDNLIPKDKMVDILYDVSILNAAKGTSKGILENNGVFPEDFVFEKHKIDSLQFAKSNEYYGFNLEEYEVIVANLEQRLNANKEEIQAKIDKEELEKKRIKDSIKMLDDSLNTRKILPKEKIKKVDYKDYPDSSK
ncbi:DUF4296 domain-containing protein [Psychroserpens sp. Hel_I_66]|uniref:DUF4296 domain-containing protein n=1 Tax=Psychroserpens sp. Hel_I_66 TaxID=1250004 RepID=UPI0006918875|nr:DUF4296 domain-containing protein [Psychroserpens sp. Hel_I_66]